MTVGQPFYADFMYHVFTVTVRSTFGERYLVVQQGGSNTWQASVQSIKLQYQVFKTLVFLEKEGNTAKKTKPKGGKDWTDEEISLLIDMLEEKLCLWDVFDQEYTKRDVKEIAYTEIASSLDTNIESIKAKINGLRDQLGRKVAKVNKTKSGQSTDELYASSWIHYDYLSFLLPLIKSSKSRDTLKVNVKVKRKIRK